MKEEKTQAKLAKILRVIGKEPYKSVLEETRVFQFMAAWLLKSSTIKGSIELYASEVKRWHKDKLQTTIQRAGGPRNMATQSIKLESKCRFLMDPARSHK